jgi:hypothetical protein
MHYYSVYVHRGQAVEFNFAFVFMQTVLGSPLHTGAASGFLTKNCRTHLLDSHIVTSLNINHIYHIATYDQNCYTICIQSAESSTLY